MEQNVGQDRKNEKRNWHITEMRMMRGKTRLDHVRYVDIRKEAHTIMCPMAEFLREKRLTGLDIANAG